MTDMSEELETYFGEKVATMVIRPDLDAVIADAETTAADQDGSTRSPFRGRVLAMAAAAALIVGGVATFRAGDSQQIDTVGSASVEYPGRIIARCLHNIEVPVGDEIAMQTVVEICAVTPSGEILGRLPGRASPIEQHRLEISPDGSQLVYRQRLTNDGEPPALVVDLPTGEVVSEWDMAANGFVGDITWSADGDSLLFLDDQDVIVQPIDGGEPTRYRIRDVAAEPQLGTALMSPNSQWISVQDGNDLVIVSTTSGDVRRLPDFNAWSVEWSSQNVLASVRAVGDEDEVVVIDPETLDVVSLLQITDGTSNPAWSPDGDALFVTDMETGWFLDPEGESSDRVNREVTHNSTLFNPAFSPDGSAVIVNMSTSREGGLPEAELVLIDATTGLITVLDHDRSASGSLGIAQAEWVSGDWNWDGFATTWPAQDPPVELDE